MNARPIEFKLSDYLSKGFELLKKDYGNFILAYFFCMILSMIPLCSLLAMGNFYKYCQKVYNNEEANPSDIFNFDDFVTYLILNLILMAGIFVAYIPMIFLMPAVAVLGQDSEAAAGFTGILMIAYLFIFIIAIFIIMAKAFYIPALISLKGITDFKEAWKISKVLTKGNLLKIVLFAIITSFLGQLGVVACGIGILLTLPYLYTSNYIAYRDAFDQINNDEIKEIGRSNY